MKTKKLTLLSIVAIFVIMSFSSCFMPKWSFSSVLQNQAGSMWISEDGKIIISDVGIPSAEITIQLETETVEGIMFTLGEPLEIMYKDEYESYQKGITTSYPEPFEIWRSSLIENDIFYMTVEKTTYFEQNQKIKFYRVTAPEVIQWKPLKK